ADLDEHLADLLGLLGLVALVLGPQDLFGLGIDDGDLGGGGSDVDSVNELGLGHNDLPGWWGGGGSRGVAGERGRAARLTCQSKHGLTCQSRNRTRPNAVPT